MSQNKKRFFYATDLLLNHTSQPHTNEDNNTLPTSAKRFLRTNGVLYINLRLDPLNVYAIQTTNIALQNKFFSTLVDVTLNALNLTDTQPIDPTAHIDSTAMLASNKVAYTNTSIRY